MRSVLIGAEPAGVRLAGRAAGVLADLRSGYADLVDPDRLVVALPDGAPGRWWTWAGTVANRMLCASFPDLIDPRQRMDEQSVRLRREISAKEPRTLQADRLLRLQAVDSQALAGMKFSVALPERRALAILAERLDNSDSAVWVLRERRTIARIGPSRG